MNLEELELPERRQMLELLNELRECVEKGEILSILAVAEMADGSMWGSATTCQNVFAIVGYVHYWATRRLGFIPKKTGQ